MSLERGRRNPSTHDRDESRSGIFTLSTNHQIGKAFVRRAALREFACWQNHDLQDWQGQADQPAHSLKSRAAAAPSEAQESRLRCDQTRSIRCAVHVDDLQVAGRSSRPRRRSTGICPSWSRIRPPSVLKPRFSRASSSSEFEPVDEVGDRSPRRRSASCRRRGGRIPAPRRGDARREFRRRFPRPRLRA